MWSPCKRALLLSRQRTSRAKLHRLRHLSKGMVCLMKTRTWMMTWEVTRQVSVLFTWNFLQTQEVLVAGCTMHCKHCASFGPGVDFQTTCGRVSAAQFTQYSKSGCIQSRMFTKASCRGAPSRLWLVSYMTYVVEDVREPRSRTIDSASSCNPAWVLQAVSIWMMKMMMMLMLTETLR